MRKVLILALMYLGMVYAANAQAQPEPRQALTQHIEGLQTGNLYTPAYNPQLLQQIRAQTGSKKMLQLATLGPVVVITVEKETMISNGARYEMRAKHKRGVSNWVFDVVRSPPFAFTDFRIDTASFGIEDGSDVAPGLGNPGKEGDDCLLFPTMCPR